MKNVNTITCKNKKSSEYIRHEYPKNHNLHPFDINLKKNYFIFADGYTYLMNKEKLNNITEIEKSIPNAYKPYIICERCFMIYKGEILWKIQDLGENDLYEILTLKKEKLSENCYSNLMIKSNDLKTDIEDYRNKSSKSDNIYLFVKTK